MFNEHSQQDSTSEQSKKLHAQANLPALPEPPALSDEELDLATGGSEATIGCGGGGGNFTADCGGGGGSPFTISC